MLTDLWEYIKALFRHWKGFVTGSALGLGLTVLTWRGIEFPDRSWGIVFLGGVVVAGFLAWREQYRRRPDPEISRHIGQLILRKVDDEKLGNGGKQRPEPDLPDSVEFETRYAVRFRVGAPNPRVPTASSYGKPIVSSEI